MSTREQRERIELLQGTLTVETSKWDKLAGAIARILRPAEQEGEP
jgi:hypothetical protein